ncbi:hypothetical protein J0X14_14330 [Muricauda sp. CAU 1633]|uniref:hypothetical protein n=1 Tax=Allomuricauda sp. CAU 1633 TaxID=2816036 RepID=UPI001A8F938B|nr:hypothetical protein [Muricauda sp. CAU 1633]MBO0323482.1 hypothetical protein [Muricauda sp. CAU 1633]
MGKVNESIFDGKTAVIPMADVQHVEKVLYRQDNGAIGAIEGEIAGYAVITKHTKWDSEMDYWSNNIYLTKEEGQNFLKAFCKFRSELEHETLALPIDPK